MKQFFIGLTVLILTTSISSAQSNFKPGYVVGLNGDTLKGSVDYQEWEKNPRQIAFKENSGAIQRYTPANIHGFGVSGLEYYEAYIVKVSMDPVDINKLGGQLDTASRVDTVFLHVLAKGKLSLYSYDDALKSRFYIRTGNDKPEELGYHAYYNSDGSGNIKYINRYRIQLQAAAEQAGASTGQVGNMIQKARYDNGDLIGIVSKINGGSGLPVNAMTVYGTRWFAGIAIMDNTLKTEDQIEAPPNHVIMPKISFGIDVMPNKNVQQVIIRGEITFNTGSYSFANPSVYPPFTGHFKQSTIAFVPQFLFNFYNTDNIKLFIDGGLGINLSQYSDYSLDYPAVPLHNYPPLAKAWISIPLKLGVIVNKKIEVYAGYTPLANLTTIPDFPVTLTTYQAGVSYLFGGK